MQSTDSKLALVRQKSITQVDVQRENILDAAEHLFLQEGFERTTMANIAEQAGITRVTLYRYFPNRDVIALEVYERTVQKAAAFLDPTESPVSLPGLKKLVLSMIHNFAPLREPFRLMGMFEQLYLDNLPDVSITQWTRQELAALRLFQPHVTAGPDDQQAITILNTVVWFLQKVALRGDATWSAPGVTLDQQLQPFEEMITLYIDRLLTHSGYYR